MNLKIISGAQTGVDRAALDAAIEKGLYHGGYVPKGRKSEDGRVPAHYQVTETSDSGYKTRTILNIVKSDATLILVEKKVSPGTRLTINECVKRKKDHRVIEDFDTSKINDLVNWIIQSEIQVLNIAGPRESKSPGIYEKAFDYITMLISELEKGGRKIGFF